MDRERERRRKGWQHLHTPASLIDKLIFWAIIETTEFFIIFVVVWWCWRGRIRQRSRNFILNYWHYLHRWLSKERISLDLQVFLLFLDALDFWWNCCNLSTSNLTMAHPWHQLRLLLLFLFLSKTNTFIISEIILLQMTRSKFNYRVVSCELFL